MGACASCVHYDFPSQLPCLPWRNPGLTLQLRNVTRTDEPVLCALGREACSSLRKCVLSFLPKNLRSLLGAGRRSSPVHTHEVSGQLLWQDEPDPQGCARKPDSAPAPGGVVLTAFSLEGERDLDPGEGTSQKESHGSWLDWDASGWWPEAG